MGIGIARDKDYNPMGLLSTTLIYRIEIERLPLKTGTASSDSVIFANVVLPHEDPNIYALRED